MSISVRIGVVPGNVDEIVLEDDATLADALNTKGLSMAGHTVQVSGRTVTSTSHRLVDGDRVMLTKAVKGNR
ncbi:MAG: hypothetical protein GTN99_02860 [Candidatus Dadabacteria bacterium]|nr:hypothetical protein [Candidatus Dadabacteria bacterium]